MFEITKPLAYLHLICSNKQKFCSSLVHTPFLKNGKKDQLLFSIVWYIVLKIQCRTIFALNNQQHNSVSTSICFNGQKHIFCSHLSLTVEKIQKLEEHYFFFSTIYFLTKMRVWKIRFFTPFLNKRSFAFEVTYKFKLIEWNFPNTRDKIGQILLPWKSSNMLLTALITYSFFSKTPRVISNELINWSAANSFRPSSWLLQ